MEMKGHGVSAARCAVLCTVDRMTLEEQRALILRGAVYDDLTPELLAAREAAVLRTDEYNRSFGRPAQERIALLRRLLRQVGDGAHFEPAFRCEFGFNISVGRGFYANFDCVMLDGGGIDIGDQVLFGPRVGIYTTNHALDAAEMRRGRLPGQAGAHRPPRVGGRRGAHQPGRDHRRPRGDRLGQRGDEGRAGEHAGGGRAVPGAAGDHRGRPHGFPRLTRQLQPPRASCISRLRNLLRSGVSSTACTPAMSRKAKSRLCALCRSISRTTWPSL